MVFYVARVLNLVEPLPVMTSINLVLCIGHVRVGIIMPYGLLLLLGCKIMMMIVLIRNCSNATLLHLALIEVTVDESMVLTCFKGFPKGTSPRGSKLRVQHLLDAVSGSTTPAAKECLSSLTCFMNLLLSGKGPTCLAVVLL